MPAYKGMEIYVVNSKTKKIEGATNRTKIGNTLTNVNASSKMQRIVLDHKNVNVYLENMAIIMLSRVLKEKYEKEKYIYTSNTDELTKCLNRRAYDTDMEKLDLNTEWAYISLDLNGLKQANDSLGHSAGDELICAASNCMKFAFTSYGKIYRIGGDEFVVLIQESVSNIDSILQVFDVTIHDWHGKYSNLISVSYGVVKSSEQDFDAVQEISKLVDERMYQNKKDYYTTSCNDRRR